MIYIYDIYIYIYDIYDQIIVSTLMKSSEISVIAYHLIICYIGYLYIFAI